MKYSIRHSVPIPSSFSFTLLPARFELIRCVVYPAGMRWLPFLALCWLFHIPASTSQADIIGPIPPTCALHEWISNRECLVQSWALQFSLNPHIVTRRKLVTARVYITFQGSITWNWHDIRDQFGNALGQPTDQCDSSFGGYLEERKCTFRITGKPTKGFRTFQLPFRTSFGQYAYSRHQLAIRKAKGINRVITVNMIRAGTPAKPILRYRPSGPLYIENGDRLRLCNLKSNKRFFQPYRAGDLSVRLVRPGSCRTFKFANESDETIEDSIFDLTNGTAGIQVFVLPE